MSVTFYEGELQPTNQWPEASSSFAGFDRQGWSSVLESPFTMLREMLEALAAGDAELSTPSDSELWLDHRKSGYWIRITRNGTIEIGEPAA